MSVTLSVIRHHETFMSISHKGKILFYSYDDCINPNRYPAFKMRVKVPSLTVLSIDILHIDIYDSYRKMLAQKDYDYFYNNMEKEYIKWLNDIIAYHDLGIITKN